MSYKVHMKGYHDLRTLYQTERLAAWKEGRYFPPAMVEISPTNRCNQQCRYCYTHNRMTQNDMMPDTVLINSFCHLADAGVQAVLVQGTGEPLLHKALPQALEAGAERGISVGLTTNGVLLTKEIQEKIVKHLFFIRFSVLDIDPKRYAYLHGCSPKQWDELVNNIKNVAALRKDLGLGVSLYATVYLYKGNFHDAYNIVSFFKKIGIDFFLVQEPTYTEFSPAGEQAHHSKEVPATEIENMKKKLMTLHDEDCYVKIRYPIDQDDTYCEGMDAESWRNGYCQGVKFTSTIASDGNVYPCWRGWGKKEFCYGNLHDKTFKQIWEGEQRQKADALLLGTAPRGHECCVCNIQKLNEILTHYSKADTPWKNFLA